MKCWKREPYAEGGTVVMSMGEESDGPGALDCDCAGVAVVVGGDEAGCGYEPVGDWDDEGVENVPPGGW